MIDIYSKGAYPACALSNFAVHPFWMDGIAIQSMEGFLQSLKYKNLSKQKKICKLSGIEAKMQGRRKYLWRIRRVVFWQGKKIDLLSDEYQILLDRAYESMYEQSADFRQALIDTGDESLVHTIGKTILTEYQFIKRLERLRERARWEMLRK